MYVDHSNPGPTATHSNPYNSLENGPKCWKELGVSVGYCGGKVTVEVLDRARAYTAAVPGAISGSRGHDQTFALANALTWGFSLDEQTALGLMLEWNAGCQPAWKERDLRHKIRESQKASHQKPFGYLLTAGERPQTFRAPQIAPPAEKAVWKIKRRATGKKPSEASETFPTGEGLNHGSKSSVTPIGVKTVPVIADSTSAGIPADPSPDLAGEMVPLVAVPGCKIGRPEEIQMADDEWRKLDASGFASEPMVQLACQIFGPCKVLDKSEGVLA